MSYNKSLFAGVPRKQVNKSRFDLSHEWKGQGLMGQIYPVLTMETLPSDEWTIESEFMFRFNPMYFPIMHKATMRADYFFIPNRILWIYQNEGNKGWTRWITEQEEYTHPTIDANMSNALGGFNNNVLAFMGIPFLQTGTGYTTTITGLNALPLSAYLKIWDEYYRVPQLEDERWFPLDAGDNSTAMDLAFQAEAAHATRTYQAFSAKWEKDYFTSALPQPQLGDAVQIPMHNFINGDQPNLPYQWLKADGTDPTDGDLVTDNGGESRVGVQPVGLDIQETAATIKQLRIAETLQSYYERIIKVGQRYRDFIEGLWGDDPEPAVVDVPVMFDSKFGRVQIADVMTQAAYNLGEEGTSRTGDYTGQANLYSAEGGKAKYYCREHGWIMCLLQVNPNTSYGQGIHRMWRRTVQTDYPLDIFSNIGDQEILKEELMYNNHIASASKNNDTFGYIPRHSEMRYMNNLYTGNLQGVIAPGDGSGIGISQHLGRWWNPDINAGTDYDLAITIGAAFTLSASYVRGGTRIVDTFRTLPLGSGLQYPQEGQMFMHIFHSISVERVLPLFATPKL